ncbi:DUF6300 family protein [Nonomuraea longicatena]|uniref:CpXC domain-containing protein n=1 Tax=Nonomuraea longicatena TaxID=83682 RepID=A0ABN1QXT7_9ACTN
MSGLACPRCEDGELLAVLRLPGRAGPVEVPVEAPVEAPVEVPLCSHCEADEPIAVYFAVNGEVLPQDAERFARLLREWAERSRPMLDTDTLPALDANVPAALDTDTPPVVDANVSAALDMNTPAALDTDALAAKVEAELEAWYRGEL